MTASTRVLTTEEVAARYFELAEQGKWFEIQDELFAEDVRSLEPPHSPYLKSAEGKANVRKKAEEWVSKVERLHNQYFTKPVVGGNHFAMAWGVDADVTGLGRRKIDEIMLYEVKDGQIVLEQFFYS